MAFGSKFAFHLFVLVIDLISIGYDFVMIEDKCKAFGGKLNYLTIWCMIIQIIYFAVAVIIDVTEKVSEPTDARSGLHKFKDLFHSSIAFPIAAFVAISFWIMYAVNKDLLNSKEWDDVIPAWLNHVMHTTIVPFMVIDKIINVHIYPRRIYGIIGACGLALLYAAWMILIGYFEDFWGYPFLRHMDNQERAIFIFVSMILFAPCYLLGEALTTFIWGASRRSKSIQKKVS